MAFQWRHSSASGSKIPESEWGSGNFGRKFLETRMRPMQHFRCIGKVAALFLAEIWDLWPLLVWCVIFLSRFFFYILCVH